MAEYYSLEVIYLSEFIGANFFFPYVFKRLIALLLTMKGRTVLVLAAHNDDQVIGAGGTLVTYAKAGALIKSIVFSFGEQSHPHLKPEVIIQKRIKESLDADRIMGGSGVAYLGVQEGRFREEIKKKKIDKRILDLIKKENPIKIFTHSINDRHPDHKAVANLMVELLPHIECPVYTFDVWTPFRFKQRYNPKLLVDTSDSFSTQMRSILAHKSQKIAIANLMLSIFFKAKVHGFAHGYTYAEVFDSLQ